MDLLRYSPGYVPEGHGFINTGSICYLNSLIQCLLSCPSIMEVLTKVDVSKNPLARNLLTIFNKSLNSQDISNDCIPLWNNILIISKHRQDKIQMDEGQQDMHEGLMMFLDAVDTIPELKILFEHRHVKEVICSDCKKIIVKKRETNLVFEVQANLTTEKHDSFAHLYKNTTPHLNTFLSKQEGYIDKGFKCTNCESTGVKYESTTLTMVPEILPILIKKYLKKEITPHPLYLIFPTNGKKMQYKLVAQCEHAGTMNFGHYWTIVLRKDGWKKINDLHVSDAEPGPSYNTYMLFYHFDKYV